MGSIVNAIGFAGIRGEEAWENLVADVLNEPSRTFMRQYEDDKIIAEYHKEYGENIYILVRAALGEWDEDIDGDIYQEGKKPRIRIEECEPYVEAMYELEVQDLEIEETGYGFLYYAICEDVGTGMEIIFCLQNVIEYLDCMEDDAVDYTGIKIVGIANEGTIVLPIEKDEDDVEYEHTERKYMRTMLERAKSGDIEAIEILQKEEEELDEILKQRLRHEDFLTVMDGYLLPETINEATYAVLGTIKEIGTKQNNKTREQMYWMYIDINGMCIEIIINKEDLIGQPYVGMRFLGTCWLQGTVEFE